MTSKTLDRLEYKWRIENILQMAGKWGEIKII